LFHSQPQRQNNVTLEEWLICDWVRNLPVPMHLGLNWRALCAPYQFMRALLPC
jgi:hypothetical protein